MVMLLDHFIQEAYFDRVLDILDRIQHPGYYAQMAVAWALAECYAHDPQQTMGYLKESRLDAFTFNKAIQKMTESFRVPAADKRTPSRDAANRRNRIRSQQKRLMMTGILRDPQVKCKSVCWNPVSKEKLIQDLFRLTNSDAYFNPYLFGGGRHIE